MAELELRLDVLGEEQIVRRLSRFGEDVRDFRPAFRNIIQDLESFTKEQFASQKGWKPLSPKYAAWKAANYPGKTILRRTDDLYNSLVGGGGGSVRVIEPLHMAYGTTVPYARYHQKGTSRLPQRKIIDLEEKQKIGIMKELQKYLVSIRKKAD